MHTVHKKRFGFIVHCRSVRELRLVLARYSFSPRCLLPEQDLKHYCLEQGMIEDIFTFDSVRTATGAECQGKAYCLLLTPELMLENQVYATELVIKAAGMACDWGARMIGLGAICGVIGARGVEAARNCAGAVTTGNSLTAYTSMVTYERIMQRLGQDLRRHKVVLVGFPGSITLVLAKMLYERGINMVLVSRRTTGFLNKFTESLRCGGGTVEITQDIATALRMGRIIFSATSTGGLIDQRDLQPGSVVFDIAQPKDVLYRRTARPDVMIVDTGLINLPPRTSRRYRYSGLQVNDIPSCLGETMALTLESRWENYSLGRELDLERVREIGALAEQHGFVFDKYRTFEKPIPQRCFAAVRQALDYTPERS